MSFRRTFRSAALLVVGLSLCASATAQQQENKRGGATGYGAVLDNIDLLIDNYANFLVRKYDLTNEQDEYTRQLLRERSYQYLDAHEQELRDLIDRMFEVRTGGDMAPNELVEWGQRAEPLYDAAKQLIVDGNNDWREILTLEQQKIHDEDLKLMQESFQKTERDLGRIVTGDMTVDEFRNPQRRNTNKPANTHTAKTTPGTPPPTEHAVNHPNSNRGSRRSGRTPSEPPADGSVQPMSPEGDPAANSPRVHGEPTRPSGRRGHSTDSSTVHAQDPKGAPPAEKENKSEWQKYVEQFIAKYQLDDEQTQQANAIRESCEQEAERVARSQQAAAERIDAQIEELKKKTDRENAKQRAEQLAELTKKRAELFAPVNEIFEKQLKPRLEKLPTRAQRRAAEEAEKKPKGKKKRGGKDDEEKPD